MKKENILKSNREFNHIINNGQKFYNMYYVLYIEKSSIDQQLFGFSVGTKIGNAVVRNKIRRQLKNIVQQRKTKGNFKCVVITKRKIINLNYEDKEKYLIDLLIKAGVINNE